MDSGALPILDDEVHGRLRRRYGIEVDAWLQDVPSLLSDLAEHWHLDNFTLVHRGTVSLVMGCRWADGSRAVLKISPDRARVVAEARALGAWHTTHVPKLLATDTRHGAVLMEAIQPGTALDESGQSPTLCAVATLLHALHDHAPPPTSVGPVEERISALYESGEANYVRRPELQEVVPHALYDRGRQSAHALAADPSRRVVLHGDLTPANVLDGGTRRGLVAIDPAPCWGDSAFDTVDLLMWQTNDVVTLRARAKELGERIGSPPERVLAWCAAFAASIALEEAERASLDEPPNQRIRMLLHLSKSA